MKGSKNPMYGRRGKSHPRYGKYHTEEAKDKMRRNHKDFRGRNNPFYGKNHTSKTKERLRGYYLGKTFEEIHGKEKAKKVKKTLSEALVGREFSKTHRKNLSVNKIALWEDEEYRASKSGRNSPQFGKSPSMGSGRGKQGYRKDIGFWVRSTWEANMCRVFNHLGVCYVYEPKRFLLETLNKTYCPDFFLPDIDIYVEVKGYLSKESNRKIKAFREEYDKPLLVVDKTVYELIELEYRNYIKGWEK